jgi:hypothetical protein
VLRILLLLFAACTNLHARPTLARIFCGELLHRQEMGLPIGETDAAWKEFTARLEGGAVRRPASTGVEPDRIQRCMNEHREEMDEGEFLLEGKRMLRNLAEQSLQAKPERALDPVLGSVNLPGFGEVQLGAMTRRAEVSGAERVTQRSTRYDELWDAFLERLRKTMTLRRDPLKMK